MVAVFSDGQPDEMLSETVAATFAEWAVRGEVIEFRSETGRVLGRFFPRAGEDADSVGVFQPEPADSLPG